MNNVDDTSNVLKGHQISTEDHPSLLALIIETNPQAWAALRHQVSFKEAIQSLLVFINGHIASNNLNQVCVLASHSDCAKFLYPINKIDPKTGATITQTTSEHLAASTYSIAHAQSMYKQFRDVDEAVTKELRHIIDQAEAESNKHVNGQNGNGSQANTRKETKYPSALSGALSIALTYMSKVCNISADVQMRSRILIISVTGDLDSQYIPIMNSIFAAQSHVRLVIFLYFFIYFFCELQLTVCLIFRKSQ